MKKLVLTLAICLGCMGILGAQNVWKPISSNSPILGAASNGDLYAMGGYSGLLRSQDEGETWQVVLGYETGFSGYFNQHCFAVSPEGRICVFNDNQQTVVYSDDGGDTWQQTTTISSCAMPDKAGLCVPTNDIMVVWAENGEISYTLDGGETWDGLIPDFMYTDNGPVISDLLVSENGDVYVGVRTLGEDGCICHSTISDMQNWEFAAFAGTNIQDMEFDPEGNVVACGWKTEGSVGFQHVLGFYLFDGTSLAIGDGGIVYTPHFMGLQAVLSYSTDHGEHFIEIGEHLPLVDIAPGGENAHLFKGADNHLYFDGGGEYWKSIRDADQIQRSFPLENTAWVQFYRSMYEDSTYYQLGIKGDTVVNEMAYKKVINCAHLGYPIEGECFGGIREDADGKCYFMSFVPGIYAPWPLLYFCEVNTEYPLYDFSLSVCDVFQTDGGTPNVVFDTDEMELNGSTRKVLWFGNNCDSGNPYEWQWIEGIGSTHSLLYSIQWEPDNGPEYRLVEVWQDEEMIYRNPHFDDYIPLIQVEKNQQWNVVYIIAASAYPDVYHTDIQFIEGDSIIDGVAYRQAWVKGPNDDEPRLDGFVREEDKRVYYRRQQSYYGLEEEVLLYDFNLAVGDTVTVNWLPSTPLMVLEESEVEVDGTMRRRLGLGYPNSIPELGEIEEYWIEGVGSTNGFLNSGYDPMSWVGSFPHLLCYYENDNLIWDNEDFDECVMNSDGAPETFAPQGAEWYFNVDGMMSVSPSYYHMEVLGDTVIQGHTCSIITRQYYGSNGNHQYVYEDNGVVYWFNQTLQTFTTLYDFNAEVGDTWICDIDSCSFEIQVESVEEVTWEGHTYRAQLVLSENNEWGIVPFYGYIIDGIGYSRGLFPDPMACSSGIVDGPYPDYLRCYLVDGDMLYHEGEYDCDEYGSCWDGTIAEAYAGGDGTAENPYQIKTSKQLALLAQQTNDGTGGDAYYELLDNINLTNCLTGGMIPWVSIGTTTHAFTGHFNGNGHSINNLHQNITDGDAQPVGGLFGCTNGAEISNVRLTQCYVSGNGKYVGTLVGYAGLTNIYNCSIYDGRASTDKQYGVAGGLIGLAGYTYGEQGTSQQSYSIMACQVKEAVKVESALIAGGVVGQVNELYKRVPYVIEGCVMGGTAEGFYVQGGSATGGIVGSMWYGTMVGCTNNQKVIGGRYNGGGVVGGLAGMINYGDISGCLNNETGQVSCPDTAYNVHVGGIAGYLGSGNATFCTNHAKVDGLGCCGGIVGIYMFRESPDSTHFIQNSHNMGMVTCNAHEYAGGIVGYVGVSSGNLYIIECSNHGDVAIENEYHGYAGGILGSSNSNRTFIMNAFNRGLVRAPKYAGGILGGDGDHRHCTIQNVYNTGVVITEEETKGAIAFEQGETDHFSDCYWLGLLENHDGVGEGEPLQHSCAFWPTTYYGEWSLDSLQFGHDLVEALNTGAEALVEQYPAVLTLVHRWEYDFDNTNDGFPVFSGIAVDYPFVGTEWYYEIQREDGGITYQHLEYASDTTVSGKDVVIIIRTNTLYDKNEQSEVTREYLYEEEGVVYWWNKDMEEFTSLYDFGAEAGDEWEIKVGMESITMHVDTVEYQEYEGCLYKMLIVSDENDLFNGTIVCGIGHLTSFFPEKLMTRGKDYRVDGMRCYWRNGELVFKYGDRDCDEVYEEWHNGIEEDGPSTGSGTLTVYPNPTHGVLVVETQNFASHPNQTYCISNVMGQTLMSGIITAETQRIDVTNLPQGMYFISVGDVTRKFVVQ